MSFCRVFQVGLGLIALVCGTQTARGQWTAQTFALNAGWNAVFLEVQPARDDCDTLFAGIPVESVWAWNRRFSNVQFIQDANQLVPGQPDWLTYLPSDNPGRSTRNLFALQGGRPYLIKLKSGSPTTSWTVTGQPSVRPIDWLPDAYNFVGFTLAGGSPTFQDFFSGSPAHAGQPAFRLSATGQWTPVANPAATTLQPGGGFWIFCKGASSFSGPVQLTLERRDGLLYGRKLTEQTLRIKNTSSSPRSITLQQLASQSPPDTNAPLLGGAVPLSYYRIDATNQQFGWVPLTGPLQKPNLQPGEEWVLRLEVNRPQMAPFVPPPTNPGVLYQSLLQISDDRQVRSLVPVSAQGLTAYDATTTGTHAPKGGPPGDARAGLWVGNAVINKVSQPANLSTPTNPLPAGAPLQFRLLVHVDDSGNARLLQKVLQMFKNGTLKPDPSSPSNNIVDQPGHYVLVTDESLIPRFTGSALRDGQPVARRLSSAAFSFPRPVALTAIGTFGSGSFTCQLNLDYDDPLNPFKHGFHPDHDNLDAHFQTKLAEGVESFSVERQIEFDFTAQDPDNTTAPGWGDDQLGGIYKETISGLHNQPIYVSGSFRLTRASTIGVLNDGL
jgi:hypothetical protein